MNENFASLLRCHCDAVTRVWADKVCASSQTQHAERLSYRQLIDHLPGLLDELGQALDGAASPAAIADSARRVRYFIHVRFQQGCHIDEVARELFVLGSTGNLVESSKMSKCLPNNFLICS